MREPLRGVRLVSVREYKTAVAWATEVRHLLDTQYPEAARIRLVGDNLALTIQCLDRWLPDLETLLRETAQWE